MKSVGDTAAMETLDLSEKNLKKLNKPSAEESLVTTLILDDNELQRLDCIDSFTKVQKLSAIRNQLLRMYGVCRLHNLSTLNLAHNGILTIEGLKDLINLKYLNLAGNSIKTIEHLNTNVNLEHLDLSENQITHISDISMLRNLKEFLVHNNKISHLRQGERYLPTSLTTLTLANNSIADLNEISQLVHLTNLYSISISNNPCVNMTGRKEGFDYRPFIINWCPTVQVIDGYVVDAIESLRGEWLYSQGRGRHFRVGDQRELGQYLATVCPLSGELLETEEDRKLRLILSKAQHHQQQLREQGNSPIPSPVVRKKNQPRNSPRLNFRLQNSSSARSPDPMTLSCYNSSSTTSGIDMNCSSIMTQSLDPSLLSQSTKNDANTNGICLDETEVINSPLQALSKLVPVPESLMSPDYRPSPLISRLSTLPTPTTSQKPMPRLPQPVSKSPKMARQAKLSAKVANLNAENKQPLRNNTPSPVRNRKNLQQLQKCASPTPSSPKPLISALKKSPSSEDESMCDSKLQTIQQKAVEKKQQKDAESSSNSSSTHDEKLEMAAVFIQKLWRGYRTRVKDKSVQEKYKSIQSQRADEYLQKLANDMESTKAALESERKIQMLQMQAINALWKKVSSLQPDGEQNLATTSSKTSMKPSVENNVELVTSLTQTCSSLQNQVQQLQGSMQDMVKFMSLLAQNQNPNFHQQQQPQGIGMTKDQAMATQTEIIAVHTPQGDAAKSFPFHKQTTRPSSLPLPVGQRTPKRDTQTSTTTLSSVDFEVSKFAGSLVDGVIKTVSENQDECCTEITVTDTTAAATSAASK